LLSLGLVIGALVLAVWPRARSAAGSGPTSPAPGG